MQRTMRARRRSAGQDDKRRNPKAGTLRITATEWKKKKKSKEESMEGILSMVNDKVWGGEKKRIGA